MESLTEKKQANILIVDDNIENIGVLGNILISNNFNLEYALNGKDALSYIEESDFDLILLDIMMPEMDGFEVCEIIRRNAKYNDLPIIFLTAKTDNESIVKGFKLGAQDYVLKPFEASELLARVNTHIELRENKIKLKEVNNWLNTKVKERTAELRKANARLLKIDNARSHLFYLISNELKSPLNKISEMINAKRGNSTTRKLQFYLELLQIASVRLENISHRMHSSSVIDNKEQETLIDLTQLYTQAFAKNKKIIDKKKLNILTDVSSPNLLTYYENAVLKRCLNNTIDFALNVSTKKCDFTLKAEISEDFNNLSIQYQGELLPSNIDINNLMETYSNHPVENNPGISLYLCNLIVEIYDGILELSNNNDMQTITIRMPQITD